MDITICKTVLENRRQLVPAIFTERQVNLVQKYLRHQQFTPSEQSYFYSAIRRKMEALRLLRQEYYVTGAEMIPERVEKAKQILQELGYENTFISGSFLYKKKYRDIDVYIITKRKKSYHAEGKHLMFITEKMLRDPIFISSLQYSVANFPTPPVSPLLKKPSFEQINILYQMSINEILNKEEERTLRELVFMYYTYIKNTILNSYSLYTTTKEIVQSKQIEKTKTINEMTKALVLKLYSPKYMYQHLTKFIKQLKDDFSKEPYQNFPFFIKLFTEVKNECYRNSKQA